MNWDHYKCTAGWETGLCSGAANIKCCKPCNKSCQVRSNNDLSPLTAVNHTVQSMVVSRTVVDFECESTIVLLFSKRRKNTTFVHFEALYIRFIAGHTPNLKRQSLRIKNEVECLSQTILIIT